MGVVAALLAMEVPLSVATLGRCRGPAGCVVASAGILVFAAILWLEALHAGPVRHRARTDGAAMAHQ